MLKIVERQGERFHEEESCLCAFVPLIGKEGWREHGRWGESR
jgi:hypothetical protein